MLLTQFCFLTAIAEEHNQGRKLRLDNFRFSKELDELKTGATIKDNELLKYCLNISDAASEARTSILKGQLETVEKQVDEKLDILARRIEILKVWTGRREVFLERANKSVVEIFQAMRPDAAASQLTELGPIISAAIIAKLEPKNSSAILTEMKPIEAAKITSILTSSMAKDDNVAN